MDLFSNYPRVFALSKRICSSGKRAAGNGSSWPGLTFIDCPVEPNPIVISQVFQVSHLGDQLPQASSNTLDRSDPSVHFHPLSLRLRPQRR